MASSNHSGDAMQAEPDASIKCSESELAGGSANIDISGRLSFPNPRCHVGSMQMQTLPTVSALQTLPVLMQVVSLLNHDHIQERLLRHDEGHLLADRYTPIGSLDDGVWSELTKQTLLSRDKNKKTISVQQDVQDAVRQIMGEPYADILMSLSSSYHCLGDRDKGLAYAKAHFKQRLLVEDSKPTAEQDDAFRAMAYTELALAWLLNDDYDEAMTLAVAGRKLLEHTPECREDRYWPHWADYHLAWALIGMGRAEEARPVLVKMLEWRRRQYGHDDTESMKTAYALQILGVVNEKAGMVEEAITTWERALLLYCKTEGDSSFRTNQMRVKLGEYYGKQGKPEAAAKMFDTALQYFAGEKYYKAERARTFFKQAEFLELIGNPDDAAEAKREAGRLFYEMRREPSRGLPMPLTLNDLDSIVMIMSR